jgi:glycine/D-amino acid oxidase-like deaminating enzyme
VIVGAGIAGLSVARALVDRGLRPTVVAPDHGHTARGAGIVSAQFRDADLRALALRSRELVAALVHVDRIGHAQVATSARGARALEGLDDVEDALPPALAGTLDPAFRRRIVRAVFAPDDLRIDVHALLAALGRGSRRVQERVRSARGGVVVTPRRRIDADVVVLAPGPSAGGLVRGLGLVLRPARVARTRLALPAMLHHVESGLYARPDGTGHALVGDGSHAAVRRGVAQIFGGPRACVPLLGGTTAHTADGRPVLRRLDGRTWVLAGLGGDGLALGPALGERVAALLLRGE